jgi:hypothetical protein
MNNNKKKPFTRKYAKCESIKLPQTSTFTIQLERNKNGGYKSVSCSAKGSPMDAMMAAIQLMEWAFKRGAEIEKNGPMVNGVPMCTLADSVARAVSNYIED